MICHPRASESHFHKKGCALGKWPIIISVLRRLASWYIHLKGDTVWMLNDPFCLFISARFYSFLLLLNSYPNQIIHTRPRSKVKCSNSNDITKSLIILLRAWVSPASSVRNLGTWFDSHLDMSTHVSKTCASAFYYLYNIRHIRKYLSRESTERLVHAFITSRLDCCNGLLYGAPEYQIKKIQRVMNASARLVYCAPKYCHVTPLLRELHWTEGHSVCACAVQRGFYK